MQPNPIPVSLSSGLLQIVLTKWLRITNSVIVRLAVGDPCQLHARRHAPHTHLWSYLHWIRRNVANIRVTSFKAFSFFCYKRLTIQAGLLKPEGSLSLLAPIKSHDMTFGISVVTWRYLQEFLINRNVTNELVVGCITLNHAYLIWTSFLAH